jgi:hypothetical protein
LVRARRQVEPGVGGSISISWAPEMQGSSPIEAWEAGRHLRVAQDRGPGNPPTVLDYFIETRAGSTVMRLVHSGFGPDASFDDEFDSTIRAWPVFLRMLKYSAEQGVGTVRNVSIFRMLTEPRDATWKKLIGPSALCAEGSFDGARKGEAFRVRTAGGEVLDGRIGHSLGYCCLELDRARLGIFCEKCKDASMLTLQWVLSGATEEKANQVKEQSTRHLETWLGLSAKA